MARIMAFDFGTKRIGIAVTDPLQIIATGLTTVSTPTIFDFLTDYLRHEIVELFVVGEATNFDGTLTHSSLPAQKFVEELQKRFPLIPIRREDERYTSKYAAQALVRSGVRKKQRQNKALLDEVSAVIILQTYLGHI